MAASWEGMLRWLSLLFSLISTSVLAAEWNASPVRVDGQLQMYRPVSTAGLPWRVCVLIPNAKDRYWWGVTWGLQQEARRLGVHLGVYEAGGYDHPEAQIKQFAHCVARRADAFIVASINPSDLCKRIEVQQGAGRPVIDLINGIGCARLSAHSRVDFADMAQATVRYVQARSGDRPLRIGWLPGPADAAWVIDADRGLKQALEGTGITLVHGGYAPLDRSRQAQLTRELFKTQPPLDYLIGNAEAALFAAELARSTGSPTRILSLYATDRVLQQISAGRLLATPTDAPVVQARIAMDLAVRGLRGEPLPQQVSPQIEMLDQNSLKNFDLRRLAPPEGYRMLRQELPD